MPNVTVAANIDSFLRAASYAAARKLLATGTNGTVGSSATPSINTDIISHFSITALAVAITSFTTNLTGTPIDGQKLTIRILDTGSAKAISWGAKFVARGVDLPTTTVAGKYLYVGFIYNSVAVVWDCIAVANEA